MIGGYEKPSSGEIKIDGEVVKEPTIKRMTVFQGYDLLPWRTARKNVELGLETLQTCKEERKEIVDKYIDLVGLTDFANHFPFEMSGGMRQRLAIARAFAIDPEVIFMDEPFSALDLITRLKIQKNILKIWKEGNKTIVFVTHIIEEAIFLSSRIVVFSQHPGRIIEIIEVPPEAKKNGESNEYKRIKEGIYRICGITD